MPGQTNTRCQTDTEICLCPVCRTSDLNQNQPEWGCLLPCLQRSRCSKMSSHRIQSPFPRPPLSTLTQDSPGPNSSRSRRGAER